MIGTVCNGEVKNETRSGWSMGCPGCGEDFLYTVLNVSSGFEFFLYSDATSDFVLRDDDTKELLRFIGEGNSPSINQLRTIYYDIENSLDECPSGGHFRIWSNVKCPHCGYEFPYNNNVHSEDVRFYDSKIIWVEGAIAYRGPQVASNRLEKVLV